MEPRRLFFGFRCNSLGFHDTEWSPKPAPETARIVVLGDSFAHAMVPFWHSYLARAEIELLRRATAGTTIAPGVRPPVEIDNLDSGRTVGWVRTGLRFLVYATPAAGTSPVCRFYRAPAFGDSHFYSASPAECAATAVKHPVDWIYESPNVFYVQLPNTATGVCPTGTTAVYRFFNTVTTNHRYTTERFLRDEMDAAPQWTPEGYGPGPYYPIMCAELT